MIKCDNWQCPGHPGKFSSCRDEALYELTLDGFYPSAGDVEYQGHVTLVTLGSATSVKLDEHGPDKRAIALAPGTYLVRQDNSGFVDVTKYELPEARAIFEQYQRDHRQYESEDDDTPFLERVDAIVQEQGWTPESLGEMALDFLGLHPDVQDGFLTYLRGVQTIENDGRED